VFWVACRFTFVLTIWLTLVLTVRLIMMSVAGKRATEYPDVPTRTKTRDLDRTRARILKAALAEFAANGLAGARCDEIARRAGVNKRMLFYCFGSKESLYREILRRKFSQRATFFESAPDDLASAIVFWYEALKVARWLN